MLKRMLTRIIAGLKRNAEYWDYVVAHCDKKLTLARNYIDKIKNCKNKQSENEEEKYPANFRKK